MMVTESFDYNSQQFVSSSTKAHYLITEQAKRLVERLIEIRGHDQPPFKPEEFKTLQNITNISEVDLGKVSGLLLKLRSGYLIKINKNHQIVRKNFSCAHEIGHILYNELKLENYVQSIEYRTFNPHNERQFKSRLRERLCDAAATEILMPETVFSKYLNIFGLSVNSVDRLAKTFMVSIPAAAIRIAEISKYPCVVTLWKNTPKYKNNSLLFDWSAGPGKVISNIGRYAPVTKKVESTSSQYKAYISNKTVVSYQLLRSGKITKRSRVESKGFGYDVNRYVISLAVLDNSNTN